MTSLEISMTLLQSINTELLYFYMFFFLILKWTLSNLIEQLLKTFKIRGEGGT